MLPQCVPIIFLFGFVWKAQGARLQIQQIQKPEISSKFADFVRRTPDDNLASVLFDPSRYSKWLRERVFTSKTELVEISSDYDCPVQWSIDIAQTFRNTHVLAFSDKWRNKSYWLNRHGGEAYPFKGAGSIQLTNAYAVKWIGEYDQIEMTGPRLLMDLVGKKADDFYEEYHQGAWDSKGFWDFSYLHKLIAQKQFDLASRDLILMRSVDYAFGHFGKLCTSYLLSRQAQLREAGWQSSDEAKMKCLKKFEYRKKLFASMNRWLKKGGLGVFAVDDTIRDDEWQVIKLMAEATLSRKLLGDLPNTNKPIDELHDSAVITYVERKDLENGKKIMFLRKKVEGAVGVGPGMEELD